MTSRVTAFDRPHRFVDEQVRGPFRSLVLDRYLRRLVRERGRYLAER